MSIRIRHQTLYRPYKRHPVRILSVDQFTKFARKLDKNLSEREHLIRLLTPKFDVTYTITIDETKDELFWLEKK